MRESHSWAELLLLSAECGALRRVTFSKAGEGIPEKAVGRLCKTAAGTVLALEMTHGKGKVSHRNIPLSELGECVDALGEGYGQINLATEVGDAECRISKKGTVTVIGGDRLFRALDGKDFGDRLAETLSRQKAYILKGDEPFLTALGISDKTGRIHDKKQAKYRQINRFLEHIRDIEGDLPKEGVLRISDLCCGKSYLSFAVYHYFTVISRREVSMLCMDLKEDVMRDCAAIAASLGYVGMRFETGDVRLAPKDPSPHLVLSLHACDVATDIVLHYAADTEARVVLSTPCCHHDLSGKLRQPSLDFVSRYPHLRGKLAEVLTDAARLARLRAHGFEVAALELTDPDDTPKNTLLRARRTAAAEKKRAEAEEEYRGILRFLLGRDAEDYPEEIL